MMLRRPERFVGEPKGAEAPLRYLSQQEEESCLTAMRQLRLRGQEWRLWVEEYRMLE